MKEKVMSLRISGGTFKRLEMIAAERGMTPSAVARDLIEVALDRADMAKILTRVETVQRRTQVAAFRSLFLAAELVKQASGAKAVEIMDSAARFAEEESKK